MSKVCKHFVAIWDLNSFACLSTRYQREIVTPVHRVHFTLSKAWNVSGVSCVEERKRWPKCRTRGERWCLSQTEWTNRKWVADWMNWAYGDNPTATLTRRWTEINWGLNTATHEDDNESTQLNIMNPEMEDEENKQWTWTENASQRPRNPDRVDTHAGAAFPTQKAT